MDHNENSILQASGLRQPSKIPSPGKGLFEMSASANNARATTMMPPPENFSLKHRSTALPESQPKRKTLAERAGETSRSNAAAPPSSRPVNPSVKAVTLAGARNTSFSSSVSSRTPSVSSRNVSGSSFSSSVGPGSRPPSAQSNHRPQTAMGHGRSVSQASVPAARPASSLDTHSGDTSAIGKRKAWDTKGRLEDMEYLYSELREKMSGTTNERNGLEEAVGIYKMRINELEMIRAQLSSNNASLQSELESTKARLSITTAASDDTRRNHSIEMDELNRRSRNDLDSAKRETVAEVDRLMRMQKEALNELERSLKKEIELEQNRRLHEVQDISTQAAMDREKGEAEIKAKEEDIRSLQRSLQQFQAELESEKSINANLRHNLSESSTNTLTLESSIRAFKVRIDYLESDSKAQCQSFAELQRQLQEAIESATMANGKLRSEETLRRKLHNQVQELKGNIRVFCRTRPALESEPADETARIAFPDTDKDCREIEIQGPEEKSSLGNITTRTNAFAFDRVFGPTSQNADVFDEISQLVQSALDGYNVCIFCYGQTGSGKTFTMSADDGMIPRAVHQIYDTAKSLEDKGWRYTMEGSFVEVYNENLNDLLGKAEEFDKKKHEIRHDLQMSKTTVTDITTVILDSPHKVESILRRATANRSVAATKANERSSRSHSVFILTLRGENSVTGEKSEGTLNLVDLAGSERLSHSGSTGERLRETQNINRSLSCLGDVIGALGAGKEGGHVPYRNSKLTYLLQFSLGGNSKTLMFVMISPLQAHLSETLTSLKFATKVHNTHIGTAKRQAKIRDS